MRCRIIYETSKRSERFATETKPCCVIRVSRDAKWNHHSTRIPFIGTEAECEKWLLQQIARDIKEGHPPSILSLGEGEGHG